MSCLLQGKLWKELDQGELLLWHLCLFLLSSTSHSHVSLADQGTSSCIRAGQNFWSSMFMKDRWESKCTLWGFNSSCSWAVEITLNITGLVLRGWRKLWFCSGWAFSSYGKNLAGCSSSLTCLLLWLSMCTCRNYWALLRDPQLSTLPCPSTQSNNVMAKGRQWSSEKHHQVFRVLAFQLLFYFPFLYPLYCRPVS